MMLLPLKFSICEMGDEEVNEEDEEDTFEENLLFAETDMAEKSQENLLLPLLLCFLF